MKHLRLVATIAMTAMAAYAAVGAGTASATTLEVEGVKKNEAVTIVGSLAAGTSMLFTDTTGTFINTCTVFEIEGTAVSPFTATRVSGSGKTLNFGGCTEPVTADQTGLLIGENIAGTTNATMFSAQAVVTVASPFGTLKCTTSSTGNHLGTLTGTATGHATLHVNAVINCGLLTGKLSGTATVTSPTGVGATA